MDDSIINSGDEEESMTAAELLTKIEELWITEKMSPTLQPHHAELVICMLDQLDQMSNNLKRCQKTDFRLSIHSLEIDRIRYVVSSYLRTRLMKIEKCSHYYLEQQSKMSEEDEPILSPDELIYATQYSSNVDGHLETLGTNHMPKSQKSLDKATKSVKPNLDSYVFINIKKDVDGLLIEDNEDEQMANEVNLKSGEQHLMKYSIIAHLLKDDSANLV